MKFASSVMSAIGVWPKRAGVIFQLDGNCTDLTSSVGETCFQVACLVGHALGVHLGFTVFFGKRMTWPSKSKSVLSIKWRHVPVSAWRARFYFLALSLLFLCRKRSASRLEKNDGKGRKRGWRERANFAHWHVTELRATRALQVFVSTRVHMKQNYVPS